MLIDPQILLILIAMFHPSNKIAWNLLTHSAWLPINYVSYSIEYSCMRLSMLLEKNWLEGFSPTKINT